MTETSQPSPKKKAPASAYVLAATFGVVVAAGIGMLAGFFKPDSFWLVFAVTTAFTSFASYMLGWVLFVSKHTVTEDPHRDENVESHWLERAGAGAFLDVFVAAGLGAAALSITGLELQADLALLAMGVLMMVDVLLRYAIVKHRAS